MRNIKCGVADIRKRVFAEVAKLAYEGGDYTRIEKLPYEIIPGEIGRQRESVFLERAIVGERIRLAMGLPLRPVTEHSLLSDGVEESAIAEKYYDPPLINVIKYACNACPPTHYEVTNLCQGCLAHHCYHACPKNAISFVKGKAVIDPLEFRKMLRLEKNYKKFPDFCRRVLDPARSELQKLAEDGFCDCWFDYEAMNM